MEEFRKRIPEILIFGNLGLKDRHWEAISKIVGFVMNPNQRFTLEKILSFNLGRFVNQLEVISDLASKEISVEKRLRSMQKEWKILNYTLLDYKYVILNYAVLFYTINIFILCCVGIPGLLFYRV